MSEFIVAILSASSTAALVMMPDLALSITLPSLVTMMSKSIFDLLLLLSSKEGASSILAQEDNVRSAAREYNAMI